MVLEGPIYIVGNVDIQIAVIVKVSKGRAGTQLGLSMPICLEDSIKLPSP